MYSSTGAENTVYSTEKGYTLTTIVFLGPTKKTGYPLSTNDIAKRYLFVNDYNSYFLIRFSFFSLLGPFFYKFQSKIRILREISS